MSKTFVDVDGSVEPDRLCKRLGITKTDPALASGQPPESVSRSTRLREIAAIIDCIHVWTGSVQQAFTWCLSQPIPSFGNRTAGDLVRAGRAEHVLSDVSRIAVGGYA
jgi:hypothetical protein